MRCTPAFFNFSTQKLDLTPNYNYRYVYTMMTILAVFGGDDNGAFDPTTAASDFPVLAMSDGSGLAAGHQK